MAASARLQVEALVAIGALDEIFVAHLEKDLGMAERATAAITGDAGMVGFDVFGDFHGHLRLGIGMMAGIIQARIGAARTDWTVVKLDKIYTKGGDGGQSGLTDGSRRSKADIRFAAIGAVDETNSAIGIARLTAGPFEDGMLARLQNDLFDLGADLSLPEDARKSEGSLRIVPSQVARLEAEIDAMNAGLAPLTSFVLPGGAPLAAYLHLARAIARRAERDMVMLATQEAVGAAALHYINRLSDHLFVMARLANDGGGGDVLWIPGQTRES